jgi:hypothetical protein
MLFVVVLAVGRVACLTVYHPAPKVMPRSVTLLVALLVALLLPVSEGKYTAPPYPKLTAIPHQDISHDKLWMKIDNHNIRSLGPNEISRYPRLNWLHLKSLPLNDNIHPSAFIGTQIKSLFLYVVNHI